MPILPQEPDVFPDSLLTEGNEIALQNLWWAIHTLPRREKELMRRLRSQEIAHCAPLIKKKTRSPQGRKRVSYVPLFPSYVFLSGSEEDRYQVMTTGCASRCLPVDDVPGLVRDLRQICRMIASDVPLTPEAKLEPGMKVRIRSGSLAGLEGTILKRRGQEHLLVAVQFLQQGASLLLEDFQVEPIEEIRREKK